MNGLTINLKQPQREFEVVFVGGALDGTSKKVNRLPPVVTFPKEGAYSLMMVGGFINNADSGVRVSVYMSSDLSVEAALDKLFSKYIGV